MEHRTSYISSFKRIIRRYRAAMLLGGILAVWQACILYPEATELSLQMTMRISNKSEQTAQIFLDTGRGYSENESVMVGLASDDAFHDYHFPLPRKPVFHIRFDPLQGDGNVIIRDLKIIDGLGRIHQRFLLSALKPLYQIKSVEYTEKELLLLIHSGAKDPQMDIVLKQPLFLQSKRILLWPPQYIIRIFGAFLAGLGLVGVFQLAGRKQGQVLLMTFSKLKPLNIVFFCLLAITAVEIILHRTLPGKAHYHEVDRLLYQMDRQVYNADHVLLGDSVARQIFHYQQDDDISRQRWAVLATNQAINVTGQYFILRRYLNRNTVPKVVVMVGLPYLSGPLDTPFADNYIRRTFTEWREIGEIFLLNRDPVFTLKSVAYKLFPSFKYRLYLQKKFLGFTNADIYTGGEYGRKVSISDSYSMVKFLKKIVSERDISFMYFKKILQITHRNNIPFQFIPPPVKESNTDAIHGYEKLVHEQFPPLGKHYSNFQYSRELTHYPESFFSVDHVHYSSIGLPLARKYMNGQVDIALSNIQH